MHFSRTGVILCTENYRDCVSFYSESLGLPVMFALDNEHSKLTSLDMGGGVYLMIEIDGNAVAGKKIHRAESGLPAFQRRRCRQGRSPTGGEECRGEYPARGLGHGGGLRRPRR